MKFKQSEFIEWLKPIAEHNIFESDESFKYDFSTELVDVCCDYTEVGDYKRWSIAFYENTSFHGGPIKDSSCNQDEYSEEFDYEFFVYKLDSDGFHESLKLLNKFRDYHEMAKNLPSSSTVKTPVNKI